MAAIRGGAIGAPFLTGFLQSYDVAQELARRERESRAADTLRAVQMGEFLRERGLQEEGQGVLADLLAQQGARTIAPPVPIRRAAPLVEPPGGPVEGAVTIPQPDGQVGTLLPPDASRPPILQAVTQGLDPLRLARQMGRPAFRQAMVPIEEAERERRKEEDRLQAQEFLKEGHRRLTEDKDYIGWTDMIAAAARRTGREQFAEQMMLYGGAARKDKDLEKDLKEWVGELVPAGREWEDKGTGEAQDKLYAILAKGSPQAWQSLGKMVQGKWIQDIMTNKAMPSPVARIVGEWGRLWREARETQQDPDPVPLWKQAIALHPEDEPRFFTYWWMSGKGMPPTLLDYYRLRDPKLERKELSTLAGQAWRETELLGLNPNSKEGLPKYQEILDRLTRQAVTAKETPSQKTLHALNQYKLDVLQGKVPTGMPELRRMYDATVDALNTAIVAGDSENEQIARDLQKFFGRLLLKAGEKEAEKAGVEKSGTPQPGSAAAILGGRPFSALSDEEKQGVLLAEAKRLFPNRIKTFNDLKTLSKEERSQLKQSVDALERSGGR